jgi:hypothetical protein
MPRRRGTLTRPKQSEPRLGIDRRQLLATTAAVTVAGVVPNAEAAEIIYNFSVQIFVGCSAENMVRHFFA